MLSNLTRWVAPEGRLRRRRLGVVVAVFYVVFAATYLPINFVSIGRQASTLFLPGEARIPFVPQFEFLYILGYLVPLLAVFRLPSVRHFHRLLVAFGLTLAVAYTTYVLFPVYLERPVVEVDFLTTFLVALEYHDPSYNHFPSLTRGRLLARRPCAERRSGALCRSLYGWWASPARPCSSSSTTSSTWCTASPWRPQHGQRRVG